MLYQTLYEIISVVFAQELTPGRDVQTISDKRAFDDYYGTAVRPHLPRLLAVGKRILRCQDRAWDALQEALFSLWQLPERPADPSAWLTQTIVHRCLHLRRSEDRRWRREQLAGNRDEQAILDPARKLESREIGERLEQALAELSAEFREVFLLREVEQLDYEAIAGTLGLPLGTVRSRLNRARAALRQRLTEPGAEEQG